MSGPVAWIFRAERIKLRRSWSMLAAVLTPISLASTLFLIFWFSEDRVNQLGQGFLAWYEVSYTAWNLFFLPIAIALVGVLSWDAEAEAGSWKHLLLQPYPRWAHYMGKLWGHLLLAVLAQLIFVLMLLFAGLMLRSGAPTLTMGPVHPGLLLDLAGASMVATLPMIGLHTWLSMRFPGLGISLCTAAGGSWVAFQAMKSSQLALFLPWGMASQVTDILVKDRGSIWMPCLGALVCATALMLLGGLDFHWREEPGT